MTWTSDDLPPTHTITPMGWVRVVVRGVAVGVVTFGCLALLLLLRIIERPLFGQGRPVTPYITQFVCRAAFVLMGIGYTRIGTPMVGPALAGWPAPRGLCSSHAIARKRRRRSMCSESD
jgi:hypothetical protein